MTGSGSRFSEEFIVMAVLEYLDNEQLFTCCEVNRLWRSVALSLLHRRLVWIFVGCGTVSQRPRRSRGRRTSKKPRVASSTTFPISPHVAPLNGENMARKLGKRKFAYTYPEVTSRQEDIFALVVNMSLTN